MKIKQLCFALLWAALATDARQPQSASIEGLVTSNIASVLPCAKVGIDSVTRGYHREALADVSGYYAIDELQSGTYSIHAEAPGYGCITYPHVAVMPGQHLHRDFAFIRGGSYSGACQSKEKKAKGG